MKSQIRREKDISGHLEADTEGFVDDDEASAESPKKSEKVNSSDSFMQMWWGGDTKKKIGEETASAKLLKEDFQILQAYNYLRAWKVMKNFEEQNIVETKVQAKDTVTDPQGKPKKTK